MGLIEGVNRLDTLAHRRQQESLHRWLQAASDRHGGQWSHRYQQLALPGGVTVTARVGSYDTHEQHQATIRFESVTPISCLVGGMFRRDTLALLVHELDKRLTAITGHQ